LCAVKLHNICISAIALFDVGVGCPQRQLPHDLGMNMCICIPSPEMISGDS
jgi:hypothetical protein